MNCLKSGCSSLLSSDLTPKPKGSLCTSYIFPFLTNIHDVISRESIENPRENSVLFSILFLSLILFLLIISVIILIIAGVNVDIFIILMVLIIIITVIVIF